MSKELKIGTVIKIIDVCPLTNEWYPHVKGSIVTITGHSDFNGNAEFSETTPCPEACPYDRRDTEFMNISTADGWRYELIK